jgi:hypothetical protein
MGIAWTMCRVAVSGRREQEASFVTVVVWRDQAEHAAQSRRRAAGSWSWAGCSSAPGPPRTAAPVIVEVVVSRIVDSLLFSGAAQPSDLEIHLHEYEANQ